jgi:hypothetical protein
MIFNGVPNDTHCMKIKTQLIFGVSITKFNLFKLVNKHHSIEYIIILF